MKVVLDIEADGLLDQATKIHCLSYFDGREYKSLTSYDDMRNLLLKAEIIIGHNIVTYDIPLVERLLGIEVKAKLYDTLALSWYLYPNNLLHGLESWGEYYGVPKPKIDDWKNLSVEEYIFRCEEDVKINVKLWKDIEAKLLYLYKDKKEYERLINYLSFKMDCIREQEETKVKLDVERVQRNIDSLTKLQDEKISELKSIMPEVPIISKRTRPAKPFKKDGTWSSHGAKWFNLLKENNLPEDFDGEIEVVVGYNEPNPASTPQVKDWLFSLGWEPCTFDYKKNKDGVERAIPQVRVEGELTESVLELADKVPEVGVLADTTIIQHRLAFFTAMLENSKNGFVTAGVHGLTNTLRFKHRKPLANIPGVNRAYGEEIRGSLVAPEGYVLCGSDMSSLEDNTKRHYMFPYDPEYVKEMSIPGYDPHLALAIFANAVKEEEVQLYKDVNSRKIDRQLTDKEKKIYDFVDQIRKQYKTVNYAGIYGVGPPKLSRGINDTVYAAKKLLEDYWSKNWSIKKLAEESKVVHYADEMWLYNPVSKFYYSLRYKKDIFSTLNQGTGVYCFDTWVREVRKINKTLSAQFHDEILTCIKEEDQEEYKNILLTAIDNTNKKLKLNITLAIDIKFGKTYAEVH